MNVPTTPKCPPPFEPLPPRLSFWERLGALFTRAGRVRRRLDRAFQTPDDARAPEAVSEALLPLLEGEDSGSPATAAATREALLYLAWRTLRDQDLPGARRWIGELDRRCPDSVERVSLRWDLLNRLSAKDDPDGYTEEARLFLADKLTKLGEHDAAFLRALRTVYEQVSPAACKVVAASANPGLKKTYQLKAAEALCTCPKIFQSLDEARSWVARIDPDRLKFSQVMRADALLVAARASEWAGDWPAMEAAAGQALRVAPQHPAGRYWLARARLHVPGGLPAEALNGAIIPHSAEWGRLQRAIKLHQQATLEHAADCLAVMQEQPATLDPLEKNLIVALLRIALKADATQPSEHLARCAALCATTESLAGRLSWAQVTRALAEVQVDRRYAAAVERLEQDEVFREPQARPLARAARILAGTTRLGPQKDDGSCFSAIEAALSQVVEGKRAHAEGPDPALCRRLMQAREDPWCRQLPALATVVDGLLFTFGRLAGSAPSQVPVSAWNPPEHTPPWVKWLHLRSCLLNWDGSSEAPFLTGLDVSHPALACAVEGWWSLYGASAGSPLKLLEQCKQHLDAIKAPAEASNWITSIRQSRAGIWEERTPAEARTDTIWSLGSVCDSVCQRELELETAYVKARVQLRKGSAEAAGRSFEQLIQQLATLPLLSAVWWHPVLLYWHGVTLARREPQRARTILEQLIPGPKAAEARTQLALLAVQQGDLNTAQSCLAEVRPCFPAAVYAQGLLQARRGNIADARRSLESLVTTAVSPASPYRLASQRLLAALEERTGQQAAAERLHRETLRDLPGDPVASARLGRFLLKRGYGKTVARDAAANSELEGLLRQGSRLVEWCGPYEYLHHLLTCSEQGLTDDLIGQGRHSLPLSQVTARRLLAAKQADRARKLLETHGPLQGPVWHQRTRLILRAWHLLRRLWSPYVAPDHEAIKAEAARIWRECRQKRSDAENWQAAEATLQAQAREACIASQVLKALAPTVQQMDGLLSPDADPVLQRWRFLLMQAAELGQTSEAALPPDRWQALAPWPLAHLPAFWSASKAERLQAADVLEQAAQCGDQGWEVLGALVAWARCQEDEYLAAYNALQPNLEQLPVSGVSLWLAAAEIWFRRKKWQLLLESDLPACVASLAEPEVRLLVGLAYARAAAEDSARGDLRSAVQKVRQARSTLEELLQA